MITSKLAVSSFYTNYLTYRVHPISTGFTYIVSSNSITGKTSGVNETQKTYFQRIKNMNLKSTKLIGFGISDHESFTSACEFAEGAIIGSAFIRLLNQSKDLKNDIIQFVKNIKQ